METIQMKTVRYFVIHCTGTDTTKNAKDFFNADETPMFHYVIDRDGDVNKLCSDKQTVNRLPEYDWESIHIAYIGGIDKEGNPFDNRNKLQQEALLYKLIELSLIYHGVNVVGAKDLCPTEFSPSFDVKQWMKNYEPTLALDREFSLAA
jgi:N-acetylmuramoyl-L-alanine amidase